MSSSLRLGFTQMDRSLRHVSETKGSAPNLRRSSTPCLYENRQGEPFGGGVSALESPKVTGVSDTSRTRMFHSKRSGELPPHSRVYARSAQTSWPESPYWNHPNIRRLRPKLTCNREVFDSFSQDHCWQPTQNQKT